MSFQQSAKFVAEELLATECRKIDHFGVDHVEAVVLQRFCNFKH